MVNFFVVSSYILVYLSLSGATMQVVVTGIALPTFAGTIRYAIATQFLTLMQNLIKKLWPLEIERLQRNEEDEDIQAAFGLTYVSNPMSGTKSEVSEPADPEAQQGTAPESKRSLFEDLIASVPYRTWSVSDVAELFFIVTMAVE